MAEIEEGGRRWGMAGTCLDLDADETLILTPRGNRRPQRIPSEPCTGSENAEIPVLSDYEVL